MGYAEAPPEVFEILRGMPPYEAPEGQEWTYIGNRTWELSDPPVSTEYAIEKVPIRNWNWP